MSDELILVVDDDPHSREIVRAFLESRGYTVVTARQGEEALALLETVSPALVVLDVMMPGIDGWEVARLIRNHPNCPRTRILMLTARGDLSDKQEGLRSGADDYMLKPVQLDALAKHVRRNLEARGREP